MATPQDTSGIVSQAFRFMEKTPPSSLADNSKTAAAASEQYSTALESILATTDWWFARRRVTLPQVVDTGDEAIDEEIPFAYVPPHDMVKLRQVFPRPEPKWQLDETFLWSEIGGGLTIRYTRLVSNESKMPGEFRTAVAAHLAVLLMPEFVGSRTKRREIKDDYNTALQAARRANAYQASQARYDGNEQSDSVHWVERAQR